MGADPSDSTLDLVNSVEIDPTSSNCSEPPALSLVAPDRSDLPSLAGLGGMPIGMWQVDPTSDSIASADLTVRYDSALVQSLGASESSVQLWTYGSDAWQPVPPATFSLDTADDLVSGAASGISYFAVTADASDAPPISAQATDQVAPSVPEPVGLGLLATATLLLGGRRRRKR